MSKREEQHLRAKERHRKLMEELSKDPVRQRDPYVKTPGWQKKKRSKAVHALLIETANDKRQRRAEKRRVAA